MNEMIDRVAAAIWISMSTNPRAWELLHPIKKDQMRDVARAAIEAMHEPTEETVERVAAALYALPRTCGALPHEWKDANAVSAALCRRNARIALSAALTETPASP